MYPKENTIQTTYMSDATLRHNLTLVYINFILECRGFIASI